MTLRSKYTGDITPLFNLKLPNLTTSISNNFKTNLLRLSSMLSTDLVECHTRLLKNVSFNCELRLNLPDSEIEMTGNKSYRLTWFLHVFFHLPNVTVFFSVFNFDISGKKKCGANS